MDKRKRFEVLIENFDVYYNGLQKCIKIRDNGAPPEVFQMKCQDKNETINIDEQDQQKEKTNDNVIS